MTGLPSASHMNCDVGRRGGGGEGGGDGSGGRTGGWKSSVSIPRAARASCLLVTDSSFVNELSKSCLDRPLRASTSLASFILEFFSGPECLLIAKAVNVVMSLAIGCTTLQGYGVLM